MSVKLNSSGGGSVTLQEPVTASDFTLTLPAQTATVITDSSAILNIGSGQIYKEASGNVGIGLVSPAAKLDVVGASGLTSFTGTSFLGLQLRGPASTNDYSGIGFSTTNQSAPTAKIAAYFSGAGSYLQFGTSNSYVSGVTNTAMTIDYSGNLLVGTTSVINGSNAIAQFLNVNGGRPGINVGNSVGSSATNCIIFTNSNGTVGSIQTSGTATSYVTSSDYRLKNSIAPMITGLETVSALKPLT